MHELSAGLAAGQRARADAALADLRKDPALVALLDFEKEENAPRGVFRRVQGRWPGSHAPEFVNVGDHLMLDVGAGREWPQLTLAAWVRIDRLGAPYQSLLHTDGWSGNNPGQVHWMINRDTTMRLALIGNTLAPGSEERDGHPARLGPAQIGNWNQKDRKLSGRVDELLLLGRAMTDTEVREVYGAEVPYK